MTYIGIEYRPISNRRRKAKSLYFALLGNGVVMSATLKKIDGINTTKVKNVKVPEIEFELPQHVNR